jgi:hypothetical protein
VHAAVKSILMSLTVLVKNHVSTISQFLAGTSASNKGKTLIILTQCLALISELPQII